MTPDHADHAAKAIKRGTELPPVKGPRCSRCQRPIRDVDAPPSLCSVACLEAGSEEMTQSTLRKAVFERDRGVCALCGLDCLALRAEMNALWPHRSIVPRHDDHGDNQWRLWQARVHQLARAGFDRHAVQTGSALYEIDHDPPKVLGGRDTLDGVRTLCLSCHKAATAALASSRAEARRPKDQQRKGRRARRPGRMS